MIPEKRIFSEQLRQTQIQPDSTASLLCVWIFLSLSQLATQIYSQASHEESACMGRGKLLLIVHGRT